MRKLLDKIWEWTGYLFFLFVVVSLVSWVFGDQVEALFAADPVQVKKSTSGICHCPGGTYYERTRKFTPYWSIKDCLASGGRHPNRGQGDCTKVTPRPGSPEATLRKIKPKSTTIKRRDLNKPRPPRLEMRIIDGDTLHLGEVRVLPQARCADARRLPWQSTRHGRGQNIVQGFLGTHLAAPSPSITRDNYRYRE